MQVRVLGTAPDDVELGRQLVHEYVEATIAESAAYDEAVPRSLINDLFPELADFASVYGAPGAAYLVAQCAQGDAGGVGVLSLRGAEGTCEMKRLWVRPEHRAGGVARALCVTLMEHARTLGYRRMALDVVPQRTAAIALYRSLGFEDAPPTHVYPISMTFLARDLRQ